METAIDVITAMLCQPRFRSGMSPNAAGEEMEEIVTEIELRRDALLDAIEASRPANEYERTRRLAVLLRFRGAEALSLTELSVQLADVSGQIN